MKSLTHISAKYLEDNLPREVLDEIVNDELLRYKTLHKMQSDLRMSFKKNGMSKIYYLLHQAGLCRKCSGAVNHYDNNLLVFHEDVNKFFKLYFDYR